MSIYHCSIKNISRSSGRSAVACAAYRSGEELEDVETGITHDYRKKTGIAFAEIFLCKNAPERFIGNLPAHFAEAVIRSRMPLRQRTMLILIFPRTGSPVLQRAGSSQWAMVLCPFSGGKGHAAPTAAGTPQWNGDLVQCLPCPLQTRPA